MKVAERPFIIKDVNFVRVIHLCCVSSEMWSIFRQFYSHVGQRRRGDGAENGAGKGEHAGAEAGAAKREAENEVGKEEKAGDGAGNDVKRYETNGEDAVGEDAEVRDREGGEVEVKGAIGEGDDTHVEDECDCEDEEEDEEEDEDEEEHEKRDVESVVREGDANQSKQSINPATDIIKQHVVMEIFKAPHVKYCDMKLFVQILVESDVVVFCRWIPIDHITAMARIRIYFEDDDWLFEFCQPYCGKDFFNEMGISMEPYEAMDPQDRRVFHCAFGKYFESRAAKRLRCNAHSASCTFSSMEVALRAVFQLLAENVTTIEMLTLGNTEFAQEIVPLFVQNLSTYSVKVDRFFGGYPYRKDQTELIDAIYSRDCRNFSVRHVKQGSDGNRELSFDWIVGSKLFAEIFGSDPEAYDRYSETLEAMLDPSQPYNELLSTQRETDASVTLHLFLVREDTEFDNRHKMYYLNPYIPE